MCFVKRGKPVFPPHWLKSLPGFWPDIVWPPMAKPSFHPCQGKPTARKADGNAGQDSAKSERRSAMGRIEGSTFPHAKAGRLAHGSPIAREFAKLPREETQKSARAANRQRACASSGASKHPSAPRSRKCVLRRFKRADCEPALSKGLPGGLSRMRGNPHVRFLEGNAAAMPPTYSTSSITQTTRKTPPFQTRPWAHGC